MTTWLDVIARDVRKPVPRNNPHKKRAKHNRSGITGVYWQNGKYQGWAVTWGDACVKCTRDFFEACCIRKSLEAQVNEGI